MLQKMDEWNLNSRGKKADLQMKMKSRDTTRPGLDTEYLK